MALVPCNGHVARSETVEVIHDKVGRLVVYRKAKTHAGAQWLGGQHGIRRSLVGVLLLLLVVGCMLSVGCSVCSVRSIGAPMPTSLVLALPASRRGLCLLWMRLLVGMMEKLALVARRPGMARPIRSRTWSSHGSGAMWVSSLSTLRSNPIK